jgi:hypothetical protein
VCVCWGGGGASVCVCVEERWGGVGRTDRGRPQPACECKQLPCQRPPTEVCCGCWPPARLFATADLLACLMAAYTSSQQLFSLYRPPPASCTPGTGPGLHTASWYSVTLLPGLRAAAHAREQTQAV